MNVLRQSVRSRFIVTAAFALVLAAIAVPAFSDSMRGKLYLVTKQTTVSDPAGTPCLPTGYGEDVEAFCDRNYRCAEGQVAKGLVMNVDTRDGKSVLTGIGLECAEPNELYDRDETGAFGNAFSGKVYRDSCEAGMFLAGVNASTDDRRTVAGVEKVCRRYWPVEERTGPGSFGSGRHLEKVACGPGNFVIGVKASYFEKSAADGSLSTSVKNFRFYCAEMRHWISEPDDVRDPRDPKTRR